MRERRKDIPLLVHAFTHKFARQMKRRIEKIPPATMAALTAYDYPGNIRELQNMIERGVSLSRGRTLDLPLTGLKSSAKAAKAEAHENGHPPAQSGDLTLEAVEREHILRVLRESNRVIGGTAGAAARLGINRTTLNDRLRKLGITRPRQ